MLKEKLFRRLAATSSRASKMAKVLQIPDNPMDSANDDANYVLNPMLSSTPSEEAARHVQPASIPSSVRASEKLLGPTESRPKIFDKSVL